MKHLTARSLIEKLALIKHPEGGYYKELYRSEESFPLKSLPSRYSGDRTFSTAIYFMLTHEDVSKFHRIKSDELWHFYKGDPLDIYVINSNGQLNIERLGNNFENGERPQITIPKNCWFGAKTTGNDYSLLGCTVAPGFDFDDFELAERESLLQEFPDLKEVIIEFT